MGERPDGKTLDRIDVNGNYEPLNCRWATKQEQDRNRQDTFWVEYGDLRIGLTDLAELLGVRRDTLRQRVVANWPEEHWADAPDRNRYVMPHSGRGRAYQSKN